MCACMCAVDMLAFRCWGYRFKLIRFKATKLCLAKSQALINIPSHLHIKCLGSTGRTLNGVTEILCLGRPLTRSHCWGKKYKIYQCFQIPSLIRKTTFCMLWKLVTLFYIPTLCNDSIATYNLWKCEINERRWQNCIMNNTSKYSNWDSIKCVKE